MDMITGTCEPISIVDYSDYGKNAENYVVVRVDIPGLKKKYMKPLAANAEIDFEVNARSLNLTVKLTDNAKNKFRYRVKQLPDPVLTDPTKTYYKVKRNDEVVLYLHKESPRRWETQLSSIGLETDGH